jgi:hypothetical protein
MLEAKSSLGKTVTFDYYNTNYNISKINEAITGNVSYR